MRIMTHYMGKSQGDIASSYSDEGVSITYFQKQFQGRNCLTAEIQRVLVRGRTIEKITCQLLLAGSGHF